MPRSIPIIGRPDLCVPSSNYGGVHIWETPKGKGEEEDVDFDTACFGNVEWDSLKSIRFLCKVSKETPQIAISFYLDFLKQILTTQPWRAEVIRDRNGALGLLGTLTKPTGKVAKDLLYLSAMRYVSHEFPGTVADLYKLLSKHKTLAARFRVFQQIHLDSARGGGRI